MNLHIIIGEDDYLVDETAKKIAAGAGSGLEVIDSAAASNADLQLRDLVAADSSFSTPPFLDPVKVTWWRNVGFLPRAGAGGPSEAVKTALEKFARKLAANPLPENQKFIISGPKLLQTSVFAKTLKGTAEIVVFSAGRPWEQANASASRVMETASAMGLRIDAKTAGLFVSRVGTDTRSLVRELEKMRDYTGGGDVGADDVAEITSQGAGVEPEIWAITDAVGDRDTERAVCAARRFERESGFAVMVTTVMERFFRQLLEMKDAQERGRFAEATAGMSPFAVRKASGHLRNWTLRELRIARFRFMELRERAVSSSGGADALVVTEIVRACRRGVS